MQDDEKKQEENADAQFAVTARLTINKEYNLPLAKLSVSGAIHETDTVDDRPRIAQRSILFVIDTSASMSWHSRMKMVVEALRPFVEEICEDQNTAIKVVLFSRHTQSFDIPRHRIAAGKLIEQKLRPQGGTDFHEASKGLVTAASEMLQQHPTFQLTVIMCSDGDVPKDNAIRGHSHWKQFVSSKYLAVHGIAPYVETIGISSDHDADVLSGFIVNDSCGNYVRCTDSSGIREAFENAQSETMGRTATKLTIEFPLSVHHGIREAKGKGTGSAKHEIIVTDDVFSRNFWVAIDALDGSTGGDDGLWLTVNGERVPIAVHEVSNNAQCQNDAIDFYECSLQDMLHTLRNITDAETLRATAREFDRELNSERTLETFSRITAEPAEKRNLQQKISALLTVDEEQKEQDMKAVAVRRAALMKEYKKMHRVWKEHKAVVVRFQSTLRSVKSLTREIVLGQVRVQEMRQHILDLHFKKKHQKRFNKLILSEEQLAQRQRQYDDIEKMPEGERCLDVTDEAGSGCFLSTLSKRECVVDAEPLWICGRVDRSGGAQVSNPELIRIQYLSPDLVSDSYFRMALESAAGDQGADPSICDSSRQRVNSRLFPIYSNLLHFKVSKAYLAEAIAHTLSGRVDIRAVDFSSLSAVIGAMLSRNRLSEHNVRRLLLEVVPSMKIFLENTRRHPFSLKAFNRESDPEAAAVPLSEKNRCRLVQYLETAAARTTAWVSTASVLYADRLMNMDLAVGHEFYLHILVQRMRAMFGGQIPNDPDDDEGRRRAENNHRKLLQVLVYGTGGDEEDGDGDESKEEELGKTLVFDTERARKVHLFALIEPPKLQPVRLHHDDEEVLAQWDPTHCSPETKCLVQDIASKIDIRGMLQSKAFFDVLAKSGYDGDAGKLRCDAFSGHKHADFERIPNDLTVLLTECGFEGRAAVLVLRAICAASIAWHSNKKWQRNVAVAELLLTEPVAVLRHIFQHDVMKAMRSDFEFYLRNKARAELIAIHSDPPLPDDVDAAGNLPELRCGWKRCGRVFSNRDQLLHHVTQYIPHRLVHRFHLHCGTTLASDPTMTFEEFTKRALPMFEGEARSSLWEIDGGLRLRAYYEQFQPKFMRAVELKRDGKDNEFESRTERCRPECVLCQCDDQNRFRRGRYKKSKR